MNSCTIFISLAISLSFGQDIEYLGGLEENDRCTLSRTPIMYGICKKVQDCRHDFSAFKNKEKNLKICSFKGSSEDSIVCCSQSVSPVEKFTLEFDSCLNRHLEHRKKWKDIEDLLDEMKTKNRTLTKQECDEIQQLRLNKFFTCVPKLLGFVLTEVREAGKFYADLAKLGDWPDMAAIGWTQQNGQIEYKCGGTIISDRFILTAAHCTRFAGKEPDTARVGDRFLITSQDDEHAQQLGIEKIIVHPDYKWHENYNDIAILMAREKIKFTTFVAPACIESDLKSSGSFFVSDYPKERPDIVYTSDQLAAFRNKNEDVKNFKIYSGGYGETENRTGPSNILLETVTNIISKEECNEAFSDHPKISLGILDSQICVKGSLVYEGKYQDTCFGDSGSPLQKRFQHKVREDEYERLLVKTVYEVPVLVGIVSFGTDCGFGVPSVNTRVAYYFNWIENVVNEQMKAMT